MSDPITQMLIYYLYGNFTKCGPNQEKQQRHRRVRYDYSDQVKDVPYILPDNCIHPKVYVCFDFTYQFVIDEQSKNISGKRLISKERLENIAIEISNYFYYYYEYVLTYGNENTKDLQNWFHSIDNMGPVPTEDEINLFLNKFINFYLTQINIDRSRTGIGNASITLRDNQNYKNNKKTSLFIDKGLDILNQLFVPMLPVMVWARGRLYKDWYFPLFDGYIISSAPSNTQGFTNLTLMCKDILELARISQEMLRPAIIQVDELKEQTHVNIWQKPLYGLDHFVIFNLMIHGNKNVTYVPAQFDSENKPVPGTGRLLTDSEEDKKLLEKYKSETATKDNWCSFSALADLDAASSDIKQDKVKNMLEYNAIHKDDWTFDEMLKRTSHKTRKRATVNWGNKITPYRTFGSQAPDTFTSEFSSRLDVLRKVAQIVYYELYVDAYGNIQYHPMRLANDFLKYDVLYGTNIESNSHQNVFPGSQVIGLEEIINVSSNLNYEELTTFLRLKGQWPYNQPPAPEMLKLTGSAIDKRKMERFGYRRREILNELFNENTDIPGASRSADKEGKVTFLDLAAEAFLDFANAELYTRTATLVFRPELEVARPVLFPDDNNVFYLNSVSHSITIGGDATTTINTSMGRQDKEYPPDLFSFLEMGQLVYDNGGDFIKVYKKLTEGGYVDDPKELNDLIQSHDKFREKIDKANKELDEAAKFFKEETNQENDKRKSETEEKLEASQETRRNAEAKKAVADARKRFGF